MMVKAVLFDFDGVLTLDASGSQSICEYLSRAAGVEKERLKREYKKYNRDLSAGELKHEDIWQSLCDGAGKQIEIGLLRESFVNTPVNGEVLEIARKVKALGLKLGMVTDNKSDRIRSIVAHHRWETLFDCICVSADVGSGKDSEDIFRRAFQALELQPGECVFIDNKEKNLVVPKALGVSTIFFDHAKRDASRLRRDLIGLGVAV